jgi:2-oxoglutarate dehydrogenase E1 component
MVPALEQIIKRGGAMGVKDIVIGMPHRRPPERAGAGDGQAVPRDLPRVPRRLVAAQRRQGSGDVKYHLGASSDREFDGNSGAPVAHRQPVAPGDRQPGGDRQGRAKQAFTLRDSPPPAAAT